MGIQKPKVLLAAQDPGGAEAVAPVATRLLADRRVDLLTVGALWSKRVFERHGLSMEILPDIRDAEDLSWKSLESSASMVLDGHPVQAMLLGTSWGPSIEKALIGQAGAKGIPSIAVLDAWVNYVERFSGTMSFERFAYLPDRIAIMDAFALKEMLALGFPEERLVVTGHPALEGLVTLAESGNAGDLRQAVLTRLSIPADAVIILFVSQALHAFYRNGQASSGFPGYDERQVLSDVLAALQSLRSWYNRPLALVVKAHPKEDPHGLVRTLRSMDSDVPVLTDGDSRELVLAADLVVGMTSMLLVEAYLAGKPTISYQPGPSGEDTLILTRSGIIERSECPERLLASLRDALLGIGRRRPAPKAWHQGATGRIVSCIYSTLGLGPEIKGGSIS